VVTCTPDSAGRTLSAIDSGNGINYVTSATYGPDSALTGFVSGNSPSFTGVTNAFSYNKRLQPLAMSAAAPSQTVFSIGYDFHAGSGTAGSGTDNGNVFGITNYRDQTRNQTFTYDALNRLASARNAGTDCTVTVLGGLKKFWGNNYTYDAWGNVIGKSLLQTPAPAACAGENLSVTADAHNWIHATGGADYQYDAAGNMTFNATPPTQNYTYDQENRLTGAAGYAYTYDGDGNRVSKSNGSTGTLYWYMTPGIVGESDLSGNLTDEYVFFDGERVARKSTNGVFYYFSDHLKTASVITDSAGVIKAESDYYPWGGELQFVNNDSNHYKFTGKERDSETGLDYFGARYYANRLGRFVSSDWSAVPVPVPYADPTDPQTLNQYSYVRNIPTVKTDADGHCPDGDCTGAHVTPSQLGNVLAGAGKELVNIVTSTVNLLTADKVGGVLPIPGTGTNIPQLQMGNDEQVAGAVLTVLGTSAVPTGEEGVASNITANAEKGAAFENLVVDATKATDSKVVEQLTLKTESGIKTRMDVVSTKASGEVRLQEAKSSSTAPLTKNQQAAHPEIAKSGATVAGKGKPDYPGGTKIPPTKVEVVRPKE
jgi:RHS repeat-associated protein